MPAPTELPPALPSSSVVYNGQKLGCDILAFEVGSSDLPGYGMCFRIDSPWILSGTNSVQPPRSGAVVQQRVLSAEAHVEAALQSSHPFDLPPVVPHGFAFAYTLGGRIGRHHIVKEEDVVSPASRKRGLCA